MDIVSYILALNNDSKLSNGIESYSVAGTTLKIKPVNGEELSIVFPTPSDGVSITNVYINDNDELICELSNGDEKNAGEIPMVKIEDVMDEQIDNIVDDSFSQ